LFGFADADTDGFRALTAKDTPIIRTRAMAKTGSAFIHAFISDTFASQYLNILAQGRFSWALCA
jgi:hypothetical protein